MVSVTTNDWHIERAHLMLAFILRPFHEEIYIAAFFFFLQRSQMNLNGHLEAMLVF